MLRFYTDIERLKHLPGKHNQRDHGRSTGRRQAYQSAYRKVRAGGGSVQEARAAALDASQQELQKKLESRRAERADTLRKRADAISGTTTTATPSTPKRVAQDDRIGIAGTTTRAYGNDPNRQYQLQHRIIDASELIPSNTGTGGINPDYDPALQPRDRSRSSSQLQIAQLAQTLNPDVMTDDLKRIDSGSPIIDARGMVVSGNGRTLAILAQSELGLSDQQKRYRDQVIASAEKYGIDPATVAGMKNPVLVRMLPDDVDSVQFAREANSSGTLRMSPIEQARVDADTLPKSAMRMIDPGDGENIDRALRSPANKPFVEAFLSSIPDNERAALVTADGSLNPVGLYRVKSAMYVSTFPGESGGRMARSLLDSLEPDLQSVQTGIAGALPALSRSIALTRTGDRDASLDPSNDISVAVDTLARIRDNPAYARIPAKNRVREYLQQSNMFGGGAAGGGLTPTQTTLLTHLDSIASKPTKVRQFLMEIASQIENQPTSGQVDLFGGGTDDGARQTLESIISTAIQRTTD
jgi:hypothetical protein